ncbi:MAG: N-acetylmannosamine-6-phosphate 2-epimerase [Anaerolineae bacterium]|nr:N-acetylmannosamine-6-phosphate 2-epimerase [Anaerolineae bacterium]
MRLLDKLRHKLIVSCQAEEGFPLNQPHHLAALAATTAMGGASAIRASDPENILKIRESVDLPIIGIYKKDYSGFAMKITPTMAEVMAIVETGVEMIAIDATSRPRPDGKSLEEFIAEIKKRTDILIMADVSTLEEGIQAMRFGCDVVSTTLSGYTPYSSQSDDPDIQLIRDLTRELDVPIFAEGRISSPDDVRAA